MLGTICKSMPDVCSRYQFGQISPISTNLLILPRFLSSMLPLLNILVGAKMTSQTMPQSTMHLRLARLQRHFSPAPLRQFHTSGPSRMKIIPVPIRSDNYMYVLAESRGAGGKNKAFLIDPAVKDALDKVSALPEGDSLDIVGVLTTHHHEDHSGGNPTIVSHY